MHMVLSWTENNRQCVVAVKRLSTHLSSGELALVCRKSVCITESRWNQLTEPNNVKCTYSSFFFSLSLYIHTHPERSQKGMSTGGLHRSILFPVTVTQLGSKSGYGEIISSPVGLGSAPGLGHYLC